ncbi:MAG: hypothetical protein GY807_13260 [Gammaproteobacteria bacterium]|nr:hypothetical protein [Gammaproteobacteria bacterium]
MKWNRIAVLVITLVTAPQALAEDIFAGVTLGQVSTEESDTDNLGFVAGYSSSEGYGYEVFYLKTIEDDSASVSGFSGDISTDVWGIFGVYKSSGDIYFKGKFGYGVVSVDIDVDGGGKFEDSESDFAFGLTVGARLGPGDLELSYTMLPDLDDFDGTDVEADTDVIALNYLWYL